MRRRRAGGWWLLAALLLALDVAWPGTLPGFVVMDGAEQTLVKGDEVVCPASSAPRVAFARAVFLVPEPARVPPSRVAAVAPAGEPAAPRPRQRVTRAAARAPPRA